ncbi:MAG TPA: leucyl/phenylalanyl-tRNA--protein transferase [Vicinamibacterales bacterium]|nr:leucyl/phenylalanyl-tRNA--protein transferase [Vicinamibacterales bacterium]
MLPLDELLLAYANGWFPMADDHRRIRWYSPDPRGILPLDRFHVPRRLARTIRQGRFEIRVDTAFREVIEACARNRDEGTWISREIIETYVALHERGFAHSVEAWAEGRLAGGLYGVALLGAFFGESMFHRVRDASKVALVALVERLRERGYRLLDVQWLTGHLEQFGAIEIPRADYLRRLRDALQLECRFA